MCVVLADVCMYVWFDWMFYGIGQCATTIGAQYEEAVARAEEKNIEILSTDEKMRM